MHISWNQYFMGVALLSSKRSKDPSTQVGACIVNQDKRIIGIGYNGFPRGCSDDVFPWGKEAENSLDTKYPYVVHAETNALLNTTAPTKGATLYVSLFPCNECAKAIIQTGIKEVIYLDNKYENSIESQASRKMFDMAGIKYRPFEGKVIKISKGE